MFYSPFSLPISKTIHCLLRRCAPLRRPLDGWTLAPHGESPAAPALQAEFTGSTPTEKRGAVDSVVGDAPFGSGEAVVISSILRI